MSKELVLDKFVVKCKTSCVDLKCGRCEGSNVPFCFVLFWFFQGATVTVIKMLSRPVVVVPLTEVVMEIHAAIPAVEGETVLEVLRAFLDVAVLGEVVTQIEVTVTREGMEAGITHSRMAHGVNKAT